MVSYELYNNKVFGMANSCSMLIREKCTRITAPVLASGLPASTIYRNMQRYVLHSTNDKHGLDIPNLYIYQGTKHIEYYVNYILDKKSICGKLLRNLAEQKSYN